MPACRSHDPQPDTQDPLVGWPEAVAPRPDGRPNGPRWVRMTPGTPGARRARAVTTGIDLSTEVERKLAKNSDRIYETDARGVLNRADHIP